LPTKFILNNHKNAKLNTDVQLIFAKNDKTSVWLLLLWMSVVALNLRSHSCLFIMKEAYEIL